MSNIAILVMSHKEAAKAMLESVEMIAGKQDNTKYICFYETMSNEDLMEEIEYATSSMNTENGLCILTDLFGGTPFKVAYMYAQKSKSIQVISGFNLPMLLDACLSRSILSLEELVDHIECSSKNGIKTIGKSINNNEDE